LSLSLKKKEMETALGQRERVWKRKAKIVGGGKKKGELTEERGPEKKGV